MGKRFTETGKWCDPWYRELTPLNKLAWNYLCDNCDVAGVIELDRKLGNFQIGGEVDWDNFISENPKRILLLPCGKLCLLRFIAFQYPTGLSDECRAHKPVFESLKKHGLTYRVSIGYPQHVDTLHDKDKDKDKDKDMKGGVGGNKPKRIEAADIPVPEGFEIPSIRKALGDWLAFKAKRGEPYKDPGYLGRKVAEFARAGPEAFVAAVNSSIGNNYGGIFPAKDLNGKPSSSRVGPGQRYRGD